MLLVVYSPLDNYLKLIELLHLHSLDIFFAINDNIKHERFVYFIDYRLQYAIFVNIYLMRTTGRNIKKRDVLSRR